MIIKRKKGMSMLINLPLEPPTHLVIWNRQPAKCSVRWQWHNYQNLQHVKVHRGYHEDIFVPVEQSSFKEVLSHMTRDEIDSILHMIAQYVKTNYNSINSYYKCTRNEYTVTRQTLRKFVADVIRIIISRFTLMKQRSHSLPFVDTEGLPYPTRRLTRGVLPSPRVVQAILPGLEYHANIEVNESGQLVGSSRESLPRPLHVLDMMYGVTVFSGVTCVTPVTSTINGTPNWGISAGVCPLSIDLLCPQFDPRLQLVSCSNDDGYAQCYTHDTNIFSAPPVHNTLPWLRRTGIIFIARFLRNTHHDLLRWMPEGVLQQFVDFKNKGNLPKIFKKVSIEVNSANPLILDIWTDGVLLGQCGAQGTADGAVASATSETDFIPPKRAYIKAVNRWLVPRQKGLANKKAAAASKLAIDSGKVPISGDNNGNEDENENENENEDEDQDSEGSSPRGERRGGRNADNLSVNDMLSQMRPKAKSAVSFEDKGVSHQSREVSGGGGDSEGSGSEGGGDGAIGDRSRGAVKAARSNDQEAGASDEESLDLGTTDCADEDNEVDSEAQKGLWTVEGRKIDLKRTADRSKDDVIKLLPKTGTDLLNFSEENVLSLPSKKRSRLAGLLTHSESRRAHRNTFKPKVISSKRQQLRSLEPLPVRVRHRLRSTPVRQDEIEVTAEAAVDREPPDEDFLNYVRFMAEEKLKNRLKKDPSSSKLVSRFDSTALSAIGVVVEELLGESISSWKRKFNDVDTASLSGSSHEGGAKATDAKMQRCGPLRFSQRNLRIEMDLQLQGADVEKVTLEELMSRLEALFGMDLSNYAPQIKSYLEEQQLTAAIGENGHTTYKVNTRAHGPPPRYPEKEHPVPPKDPALYRHLYDTYPRMQEWMYGYDNARMPNIGYKAGDSTNLTAWNNSTVVGKRMPINFVDSKDLPAYMLPVLSLNAKSVHNRRLPGGLRGLQRLTKALEKRKKRSKDTGEKQGRSEERDGEEEARDGEEEARDGEEKEREGDEKEREGDEEARDGEEKEREGDEKEREWDYLPDNGLLEEDFGNHYSAFESMPGDE